MTGLHLWDATQTQGLASQDLWNTVSHEASLACQATAGVLHTATPGCPPINLNISIWNSSNIWKIVNKILIPWETILTRRNPKCVLEIHLNLESISKNKLVTNVLFHIPRQQKEILANNYRSTPTICVSGHFLPWWQCWDSISSANNYEKKNNIMELQYC